MAGLRGVAGTDPLAAALLPVLIHRLNNATQLLQALGSLAAEDREHDWIAQRGADLGRTSAEIEELGYVLAVLASAGGADLLLERREARGVAYLVAACRDALRRRRRRLAEPGRPLPDLAPDAGHGWEAPWAAASVLWAAGSDLEGQEELAWSLEPTGGGGELRVDLRPGSALNELAPRIAARGAGLRLRLAATAACLEIPAAWLRFDASR